MTAAHHECQRYYQPWLVAHGSPDAVAQRLSSLAELDPQKRDGHALIPRDESLTAFAHSVVLRLNVQRCFISLLDDEHQYFLCEATRSCSSQYPRGAPGDEIRVGGSTLLRAEALCENCLDSKCKANDSQAFVADGAVVDDCRHDPRFATRPHVLQEEGPCLRFYAGVTLESRRGHTIGVLAVGDKTPRNGLSADELEYMQDMARRAVVHLEWARDRVDRFKGERVARGMATFIQEATRLHGYPETTYYQDPPPPQSGHTRRSFQRRGSRNSADEIFSLAADIMRESTLADGCVIFGATADIDSPRDYEHNGPRVDRLSKTLALSISDQIVPSLLQTGQTSPTITLGNLQECSEASPHGCSFTFTGDGQALTAEEELEISFGGNGTKKSEMGGTKHNIDHEGLLQNLPGVRNITFLPLRHPVENRLLAGVFLWTSKLGTTSDTILTHLQAFASCIVGEIIRTNLRQDGAAKTTFMASISHELRSPLHGILGSAEFLIETSANAYEAGLVSSIITCGKTLLDTLNHVLDYSKINKLKGLQTQPGAEREKFVQSIASPKDTTDDLALVDLGALVEEVADAVTAAHTFKIISTFSSSTASVPIGQSENSFDSLTGQQDDPTSKTSLGVAILLDISPRDSWVVKVQQGSLQRIVMNLLGNALKYTSEGFVALSLRTLESTEDGRLSILIRVVDSGKGMSDTFQQENLFVPFSQEDPFCPGTGLGLSIVKQIVDSLKGSIEVRSSLGAGTEIDVFLKLPTESSPMSDKPLLQPDVSNSTNPLEMHKNPLAMATKLAGKKLILLDPLDPNRTRTPMHQASRFQQTVRETCERWFGMSVSRLASMDPGDDVDIYLYGEPPPMELLRHHKREYRQKAVPVIIACQNGHDAIEVVRHHQKFLSEVGEVVEVIQEPCGPRKLAKTFMYCLNRADEINSRDASAFQAVTSPNIDDNEDIQDSITQNLAIRPAPARQSARTPGEELHKSVSPALALPTIPAIDPETPAMREETGKRDTTLDIFAADNVVPSNDEGWSNGHQQVSSSSEKPHVLVVDDNKINRQLLVTFMKKHSFTYEQAENGQEAVDLFTASVSNAPFGYILMDISMPVMDGLEATRRIRAMEMDQAGLEQTPTKIFALTGLASRNIREEAETAGVDIFLPKPVKFAELKALLV